MAQNARCGYLRRKMRRFRNALRDVLRLRKAGFFGKVPFGPNGLQYGSILSARAKIRAVFPGKSIIAPKH